MTQHLADELVSVVDEAAVRLRSINEADAATKSRPDIWSIKEIIGHLIDSAANNHQRFVRAQQVALFEFPGYEQDSWVSVQDYQPGISVLPAPDGPLYTRRAAERTKLLSSHIRPAPEAVTSARADVRPTGAPAFRAFLRHRSTRVPFLRQAGFVALSPRVSLPAPVAPRSSAASRRKAAGSDALPPAGASSTAHASPAAPRSSPAAAGDS